MPQINGGMLGVDNDILERQAGRSAKASYAVLLSRARNVLSCCFYDYRRVLVLRPRVGLPYNEWACKVGWYAIACASTVAAK